MVKEEAMKTKTVIFDHDFWIRFGENLDWYEGVDKKGHKNGTGYPELFWHRDLLDGDLGDSIKPEDKERYNEFCRQVEEIRTIGMDTKRKRKNIARTISSGKQPTSRFWKRNAWQSSTTTIRTGC